jgi:hypothetical protein
MIIPRHANAAGDIVIARCELHACAGGLLADGRAIELLPRRLIGWIGEAALGLEFGAPPLQFLIGNKNVGAAFVEVDPNSIPGLEDRKAAVRGGFRRRIQDRQNLKPDWRPPPIKAVTGYRA